MANIMSPSTRESLLDLRARFNEHSKRHRSLYHALIEASPALLLEFVKKTGWDLFFVSGWMGVLICSSYLGPDFTRLRSCYFQRMGRGDGHPPEAEPEDPREQARSRENILGAFRELARAAGRCLTGLPVELRGLASGAEEDPRLESLRINPSGPERGLDPAWIEADYWLITIHRLAWQGYRHQPGSLLSTRPTLWEWDADEFVPALHDVEERELKIWHRIDSNQLLDWGERGERDLIISHLPFDVFQCSVYAIDLILEMDAELSRLQSELSRQSTADRGGMAEPNPPDSQVDATDVATPLVDSAGQAREGKAGKARKRRVPRSEAELRIAEHLKKHPDDKLEVVAKATGVSNGAVAGSFAWKTVRAARKANKEGKLPTRQLTNKILAAKGVMDESIRALDALELARRRILEGDDMKLKSEFANMPINEQRAFLELYAEQIEDDD